MDNLFWALHSDSSMIVLCTEWVLHKFLLIICDKNEKKKTHPQSYFSWNLFKAFHKPSLLLKNMFLLLLFFRFKSFPLYFRGYEHISTFQNLKMVAWGQTAEKDNRAQWCTEEKITCMPGFFLSGSLELCWEEAANGVQRSALGCEKLRYSEDKAAIRKWRECTCELNSVVKNSRFHRPVSSGAYCIRMNSELMHAFRRGHMLEVGRRSESSMPLFQSEPHRGLSLSWWLLSHW